MTKFIKTNFEKLLPLLDNIETDLLLFVIDSEVHNIYKKELKFDKLKTKYILWSTPQGEETKTFNQYEKCTNFFLEKGVHRKAHLVAIGGGAISDFGGFVAATILRGISWSIVPTTLLSMVDASIGGKVGINSKNAKNQLGAFHLPINLFLIRKFLDSLNDDELNSGKGEIVKYLFLNQNISAKILEGSTLNKMINLCGQYKQMIVEKDLKELGDRKLLNLGHTLGHCLEKIFNLKHGISVIWGMAFIFFIFDEVELFTRLKKYIKLLNIEIEKPIWYNKDIKADKIINLLKNDKKISEKNSIDLILIKENQPIIKSFSLKKISSLLKEKSSEFTKISF